MLDVLFLLLISLRSWRNVLLFSAPLAYFMLSGRFCFSDFQILQVRQSAGLTVAGEIELNFPENVVKEVADYFFTLGHFGLEDISI